MADSVDLNTIGAISSMADTDKVTVITSAGAKSISFASLANAIRETIQIGGRNLAMGTSSEMVAMSGTKSYELSEPLSIGDEVTVSFEIDFPTPKPYFEVYLAPQVGGNTTSRHMLERSLIVLGYNKFTFNLKKDGNVFGFYALSSDNVSIGRVKVERGNMATDYSPAPEDITSAQSGGGITNCQIVSYSLSDIMSQRGGRHERGNRSFSGCPQSSSPYVDCGSRTALRLQRHQCGVGNICSDRPNPKSSKRSVQIWDGRHCKDHMGRKCLYLVQVHDSRHYRNLRANRLVRPENLLEEDTLRSSVVARKEVVAA